MPLSLVLHATFLTWHRDLSRWNAWNQIVDLELTLLDRARGAFLGRWFGAGLPMLQGELLVFIANLDELKIRYGELRRGALKQDSDRNLTEPIAGITGTLVGALLSPPSSILVMPLIAEQMPTVTTKLAAATNAITWGGLGVLIAALGVPLVGLGLPALALRQPALGAAGFRLLGALTGFFMAARRLIEQLVGPRQEVRNPLLKQMLEVLDSAARLVPFLFILAELVINWAGSKLAPLAGFLDRLITIAQVLFQVINDAVADLFDRLQDLYVGKNSPWQVVKGIVNTFRQWLGLMTQQIGGLLDAGGKVFDTVPIPPAPGDKGKPRTELRIWRDLKDAFDKVVPLIKKLTSESWLALRFKEIGARLTRIIDIFSSVKPSTPAEKSWFGRQVGKVVDFLELDPLKEAVPPWPAGLVWPDKPLIKDFPSAEIIFGEEKRIADRGRVQSSLLFEEAFKKPEPREGYVFDLDKDAQTALERIRRPPEDVFTAERKALLARPELEGKTFEDFLENARKTEAKLRSSLFAVLDGVLPDLAAQYVPTLQGLFWELDTALYGKHAEFPVRDLPGGDLLNVKVRRVRVRAPGMKAAFVRDWGKDLKIVLEQQVYRTGAVGAT